MAKKLECGKMIIHYRQELYSERTSVIFTLINFDKRMSLTHKRKQIGLGYMLCFEFVGNRGVMVASRGRVIDMALGQVLPKVYFTSLSCSLSYSVFKVQESSLKSRNFIHFFSVFPFYLLNVIICRLNFLLYIISIGILLLQHH